MAHKSTLYLIDISNFIFRAFYAVRSLTAPDKTPVNAVYGVLTMLIKFIEEKKPEYLLIAQDSKEKSFRAELYDEYKANRSAPPEELKPQFAILEEMYDALNLPRLRVPGVEADDILASFAEQFKSQFEKVVIISGDKDLLQLVGENITVWDSMKEKVYTRDEVFEKLGVYPEQVVDYLSLVGDSSDNIPGVKGIGDKGAQKLIAEHKSLDGIYEHISDIKNAKALKSLTEHKADAYLSHQLVTVKKDLSLPFDVSKLKYEFAVNEVALSLFKRLGFKSLLTKYESNVPPESLPTLPVDSIISWEEALSKLDVDPSLGNLLALEVASSNQYHIKTRDFVATATFGQFLLWLRGQSAQQKKITIYVNDAKSLIKEWIEFGLSKSTFNYLFEVPLAQFLVEETQDAPLFTTSLTQLWEQGPILQERLKDEALGEIFYHLDSPLNYVLAVMEKQGILLDSSFLKKVEDQFSKELQQIESHIKEMSNGMDVNLKSPKQVGELLFEKLQLPIIKVNKTGPSTDSSVLQKLAQMNLSPVPSLLLKFREIEKLLSTYVITLPKLADKAGRIHTSFRQTVAATGRLSSDTPNLQNIPIKTENGRLIRQAFIAPPGFQLLSADYSQIELRILAHLSQDPFMLKAFKEDIDIHTMTAAEVFGVPVTSVTNELRSRAKAINFGLMYGQTAFGLSESLGISQSDAKTYIKHYFERFSKVKAFLDTLKEKAMETGLAQTMLGRKRKIPNINSQNRLEKSFAERVAINSPIQGTAADIIKRSMLVVQDYLESQNLQSKLLLQIHDELVLECPEAEIAEVHAKVVKLMETAVVLSVPLRVDSATGAHWAAT
jgi:DNA polymerase-1